MSTTKKQSSPVTKKAKKPETLKERLKKVYSKYGEKCRDNKFLQTKMKKDFERLGSNPVRFNGSVKRTLNKMLNNGEL